MPASQGSAEQTGRPVPPVGVQPGPEPQVTRGTPAPPDAQPVPESSAVVVFRVEGQWEAVLLPAGTAEDLDALLSAVRRQSGDGGSFALVDVAHEFLVVARVLMGRERVLLSDVTAAVAWDLARQVVERLDLDVPADDDLEDVWPAGDLAIFQDLGMDEMELGAVLSDLDAYADEMLGVIARRLGFAEVYERVLDAIAD